MDGMISGVVIPSMLVVLVALAIMVACIYLMSYVVERINIGKKAAGQTAPPPKAATEAAAADPAPVVPAAVEAPASLTGEVVAAICAAVSCVVDTPHVVTGIAPAAQTAVSAAPAQPVRQRPVWGFAGMQQNTRPF